MWNKKTTLSRGIWFVLRWQNEACHYFGYCFIYDLVRNSNFFSAYWNAFRQDATSARQFSPFLSLICIRWDAVQKSGVQQGSYLEPRHFLRDIGRFSVQNKQFPREHDLVWLNKIIHTKRMWKYSTTNKNLKI